MLHVAHHALLKNDKLIIHTAKHYFEIANFPKKIGYVQFRKVEVPIKESDNVIELASSAFGGCVFYHTFNLKDIYNRNNERIAIDRTVLSLDDSTGDLRILLQFRGSNSVEPLTYKLLEMPVREYYFWLEGFTTAFGLTELERPARWETPALSEARISTSKIYTHIEKALHLTKEELIPLKSDMRVINSGDVHILTLMQAIDRLDLDSARLFNDRDLVELARSYKDLKKLAPQRLLLDDWGNMFIETCGDREVQHGTWPIDEDWFFLNPSGVLDLKYIDGSPYIEDGPDEIYLAIHLEEYLRDQTEKCGTLQAAWEQSCFIPAFLTLSRSVSIVLYSMRVEFAQELLGAAGTEVIECLHSTFNYGRLARDENFLETPLYSDSPFGGAFNILFNYSDFIQNGENLIKQMLDIKYEKKCKYLFMFDLIIDTDAPNKDILFYFLDEEITIMRLGLALRTEVGEEARLTAYSFILMHTLDNETWEPRSKKVFNSKYNLPKYLITEIEQNLKDYQEMRKLTE